VARAGGGNVASPTTGTNLSNELLRSAFMQTMADPEIPRFRETERDRYPTLERGGRDETIQLFSQCFDRYNRKSERNYGSVTTSRPTPSYPFSAAEDAYGQGSLLSRRRSGRYTADCIKLKAI
jgi:hypothetical protein